MPWTLIHGFDVLMYIKLRMGIPGDMYVYGLISVCPCRFVTDVK